MPQIPVWTTSVRFPRRPILRPRGYDANHPRPDAVKTIEEVHKEGGKILSFLSYCGGLPAPENSNNPLGYKFSWSPRGVLLALRNSARFYENGKIVDVDGPGKNERPRTWSPASSG